jgi:hypothetical protein
MDNGVLSKSRSAIAYRPSLRRNTHGSLGKKFYYSEFYAL